MYLIKVGTITFFKQKLKRKHQDSIFFFYYYTGKCLCYMFSSSVGMVYMMCTQSCKEGSGDGLSWTNKKVFASVDFLTASAYMLYFNKGKPTKQTESMYALTLH